MGLIRTLLALAVVLGHTPAPYVLVGGRNAVQMFYAISGFLISYVLVERRSYDSTSAFYANRYLRLYPIYLVVAVLSLFGCLLGLRPGFLALYEQLPLPAAIWLVLSNLFIVGQDWLMFAAVQAKQLVFTADFRQSELELWKGLLAPQAWTLGVELSFYLVAPFILGRKWWLLALLLASLGLRLMLIRQGIGLNDPWDYRFFPTELALFILGALAHQILRPLYARYMPASQLMLIARGALALVLATVLIYPLIPWPNLQKSALLFALFLPALPLLFVLQSGSSVDRMIGELSYPIYICHWLVIEVCTKLFGEASPSLAFLACVVGLTLMAAYGLNRYIGEPVERVRAQLRARYKKPHSH